MATQAISPALRQALAGDSVKGLHRAVEAIDWTAASEDDFRQAIQSMVDAESDRRAWELAQIAQARFPANKWLANAARVLAPARVVGSGEIGVIGLNDSVEWTRAHQGEHRDQWVGIKEGKLIATAATYDALLDQLAAQQLADVLVFHND